MLSLRLKCCSFLLLLSATTIWAAPKPKPKPLKAGDECVVEQAFAVSAKAKAKGQKQKIAAGAHVRVLAVDKGEAQVDADGKEGFAAMRLLVKVCKVVGDSGSSVVPEAGAGMDADRAATALSIMIGLDVSRPRILYNGSILPLAVSL